MNCPHCNNDVSPTARYCPTCGNKIDFTFDDIKSSLSSKDKLEKEIEKVKESRRVLIITLFLLLVSLLVYIAVPSPRIPEAVPVYRVDIPADVTVETADAQAPIMNIPE